MFAILSLTHSWMIYFVYWTLPSLTILNVIFRIRTTAEHLGLDQGADLSQSRTIKINFFEKLILAPCNVNYHLEHHLFPTVPHYRLTDLHRLLNQAEAYRLQASVTRHYFAKDGTMARLMR